MLGVEEAIVRNHWVMGFRWAGGVVGRVGIVVVVSRVRNVLQAARMLEDGEEERWVSECLICLSAVLGDVGDGRRGYIELR